MAIFGHLHKIQIGGVLAGTESWSIGFHYLRADVGNMLIPGAMANAFNAWWTAPTNRINGLARLDFIKANELDPLPRINAPDPVTHLPRPASPAFTRYLTAGGTNELFFSPGTAPAAGSAVGIPQNTIALSLATSLSRGPAHLGRCYPPTMQNVSADGRIGEQNAIDMATLMSTLVSALNAANLGKVVVYSGVKGPDSNNVIGIKCGRIVDTQRRRRKNLLESYSFMPVT